MTTAAKNRNFRIWTGIHRFVFTSTKGRIAGRAMGMPVLMLTTIGRTSGQPRKTMLTAPLVEGDTLVLAASFGGDDDEPSWCKNLRKNPDVTVTMRGQTKPMVARVASDEERAELWPKIAGNYKNYAGYQEKTSRQIPVVLIEPAPAAAAASGD
jgi:deazaflavin-dependent oxidoreductase (nitroreductase family)